MKLTKIPQAMQRSLQTVLNAYPNVMPIVHSIARNGGVAFLVGGAVRDLVLALPVKDLDIEVHGLSSQKLESLLQQHGVVDYVGKQFGVFRVRSIDVDWSLPRRDSTGRKPEVIIDPDMDVTAACRRRDLTMNAMMIDLLSYVLVDPFNGYADIRDGIFRTPDPDFFVQDPLRFYRVMQFVGRFNMYPDTQLQQLCKTIAIADVSIERIEKEFEKLFLQSERPSLGIRWLVDVGRLKHVLPEVAALRSVQQDPEWHPEGTVFEHTMQAIDAAAQLSYPSQQEKLIGVYAALCHDLGKVSTTYTTEQGRIKSTGHAQAGVALAKKLLARITRNKQYRTTVAKLVRDHMAPGNFVKNNAGPAAYKRLALKLAPQANLRMLANLARADKQARNPEKGYPKTGSVAAIDAFVERAQTYGVFEHNEPPVLKGQDLQPEVTPGPHMGELLKRAYAIQLEEGIRDPHILKERVLADDTQDQ